MQKPENKNKKRVFAFALFSLSMILTLSFAGPSYAQSQGGYCTPNLAVYPNGQDPCCPNHAWICPTNASGSSYGVGGTTASPVTEGNSSFTCSPSSVKDFKSLIENLVIGCFYSLATQLIIALSVVIFLWGVFQFVRSEGDDREAGKQFMIYGIIGLFVILSVMGLVSILGNTFGLAPGGNSQNIVIPQPAS